MKRRLDCLCLREPMLDVFRNPPPLDSLGIVASRRFKASWNGAPGFRELN